MRWRVGADQTGPSVERPDLGSGAARLLVCRVGEQLIISLTRDLH